MMFRARSRRTSLHVMLLTIVGSSVLAGDTTRPVLYALTAETGMPHLEENLRYSVTQELRCLSPLALERAFPVLAHASLKGCRLVEASRAEDAATYGLVCDGSSGTTGQATWRHGEGRSTGMLNVKLGGKNMTFYQRITAVRVKDCAAGAE